MLRGVMNMEFHPVVFIMQLPAKTLESKKFSTQLFELVTTIRRFNLWR